ncbi:Arrestin domain-containing protein 3, partial [Blomia tropicalis]
GISTSFEGKYGNVRYWIKAEIEKPWSFDYRTKKAFTLISPIDINRSEYLVPLEKSIEKTFCCLWCTSGHIGLYAKTERIGYCPGESIAINAEFENHTRRTIIPQATLHQTQLFLASGKVRSRTIKFTTVTGIAIQPHKTATWDGQMLKIPPISPSILNCRLIRVEYMIRISLHIPLGGYRCSVDLPIVIGTVPFNSTNHSNGNNYQATPPPPPPPLSLPTGNRVGRQPRPYLGRSLLPSNHCRTSNNVQERTQNHHNHHHHHHHHHQTQQRSNTPPPTYAECISGSVDIDDEDEEIIGNTRFTPRYIYVNSQRTFCPPPAYSETDPFPTHSLTLALIENSSRLLNVDCIDKLSVIKVNNNQSVQLLSSV